MESDDIWDTWYECKKCGKPYNHLNKQARAQRNCPKCGTKNLPVVDVSIIILIFDFQQ